MQASPHSPCIQQVCKPARVLHRQCEHVSDAKSDVPYSWQLLQSPHVRLVQHGHDAAGDAVVAVLLALVDDQVAAAADPQLLVELGRQQAQRVLAISARDLRAEAVCDCAAAAQGLLKT